MAKLQRFCFCLAAFCIVTSIGLNVYVVIISRDGRRNHALTSLHTEAGFSTNFTFPSRKARIAYYMGDWYGETPTDIPCQEMIVAKESKLVSDKAVLYSVRSLVKSIKAIKDWRVGAYLRCANDVINNGSMSDVERGDRRIILSVGDSHSRSSRLPVIAKTRFSRFAVAKGTGDAFFKTIIWPLEVSRHYRPIDQYMTLYNAGQVPDWGNKTSTLIWRGAVTGMKGDHNLLHTSAEGSTRIQVVSTYYKSNISIADVAFPKGHESIRNIPPKFRHVKGYVREHGEMVDQLQHKYILSLEGNDVATGLKWQLASNSVVFMAEPSIVSFAMEDMLVPYVHYVPVKTDYSDLIEMVEWARKNDRRCKWISEQATLFMERLWIDASAKDENVLVRQELGETYHRQFGEAIKKCHPNG